MKRRKWLCALIATSICAGLMGTSSFAQGKLSLTISSGPIGGDWYSMGGAIGEMIKETFPGAIVTVTTGGALENISKIHAQKADIGFTMAKLYYEALRGIGAYEGKGKQEEIRAVAFLDAGNVYLKPRDIDLGRLRYASGFGVRYQTPVGPVGLDVGFPLNPLDPKQDSYRLYFTIGQAF